jgi:hypothetical protein
MGFSEPSRSQKIGRAGWRCVDWFMETCVPFFFLGSFVLLFLVF